MKIFEISLFWITLAPTWYGLAYAIGFLLGYFFLRKNLSLDEKKADILFFSIFICGILGGRLGYVLFYNSSYFLEHPLQILATWNGGMSFHGGIIGGVLGVFIGAKKLGLPFLRVGDEVATIAPVGILLGRIANYVNGELYGFAGYTGPFAMKIGETSHFPSPLFEGALEGVILGSMLYFLHAKTRTKTPGILSAVFLIWYAVLRIFSEFFRTPDIQIGYLYANWLTLGQLLSPPFLIAGLFILIYRNYARKAI